MEHIENENGDIWRFYSISEAKTHKSDCINWEGVLSDFELFFGKIWENRDEIRYYLDGNPVYKRYKIVGLEDNIQSGDYYWILEDHFGKRITELANDRTFREQVVLIENGERDF